MPVFPSKKLLLFSCTVKPFCVKRRILLADKVVSRETSPRTHFGRWQTQTPPPHASAPAPSRTVSRETSLWHPRPLKSSRFDNVSRETYASNAQKPKNNSKNLKLYLQSEKKCSIMWLKNSFFNRRTRNWEK